MVRISLVSCGNPPSFRNSGVGMLRRFSIYKESMNPMLEPEGETAA